MLRTDNGMDIEDIDSVWDYLKPENQHAAAKLFEDLDEKDLAKLAEDIKANGQQEPIRVFNGKLIDGKNRLRACLMADVVPDIQLIPRDDLLPDLTYQEFNAALNIDERLVSYALSKNLARRHLTPAQRAAIVVEADRLNQEFQYKRMEAEKAQEQAEKEVQRLEEEKRKNEAAIAGAFLFLPSFKEKLKAIKKAVDTAKAEGTEIKTVTLDTQTDDTTIRTSGRKRDHLAGLADVGSETIAQVQKIAARAPERLKQIAAGKLSIAEAAQDLPPLPHKENKAKYPILPPPPVLPPTNPETIKQGEKVLALIKLVQDAIENFKIGSVEEFELAKKIHKAAGGGSWGNVSWGSGNTRKENLHDWVSYLTSTAEDKTAKERKSLCNAAAESLVNEFKRKELKKKPATWQYGDENLTDALKLLMAPLGYRKTMGCKFKLTDDFNQPEPKQPRAKKPATAKAEKADAKRPASKAETKAAPVPQDGTPKVNKKYSDITSEQKQWLRDNEAKLTMKDLASHIDRPVGSMPHILAKVKAEATNG